MIKPTSLAGRLSRLSPWLRTGRRARLRRRPTSRRFQIVAEDLRLEEQHRRLSSKLDVLYDDRLEGRISPEMYDRKALEYQNQTTALGRRIEEIRAGAPAPAQGAIDVMALTSRSAGLFLIQPPHEKQAFLRLVLKSAAWRHGELQIQFEEPFENLRRSNQLSGRKDNEIGDGTTRNQIWLPGMDSNHD